MKTIKFPLRAIILATIFFLAGFASLMLTNLNKEYIGIIFLCIPVCFLSTGVKSAKESAPLFVFLGYGLAFAIYNLDTNLYIAKFIGMESFLRYSGWIHWFGVLTTGFVCLILSAMIIIICNPESNEKLTEI